MADVADFHLGADVYSSDGKHIGTLHRLVVGADRLELRDLVVKEGRRFSGRLLSPGSALMIDDLVVPASDVADISRDRLTLTLTAAEARRLPPYLSYRFEARPGDVGGVVSSLIGGSPYAPGMAERAAEAPGELEIEAGENVMLGHTGKKLGEVKDALVEDGALVGVVLVRGLFDKEFILPRRFLDRSDDLALFARLTEEDLQHLEPFEPAD